MAYSRGFSNGEYCPLPHRWGGISIGRHLEEKFGKKDAINGENLKNDEKGKIKGT
jgi:hypothetical protein